MPNQFLSDEFGDIEDYFVTDYWLIDQFVGDTLWTWGRNNKAQLGTNDGTQRNTPVTTFAGGTTWKQVAAGREVTFGIKTDGTLWGWGANGDFEDRLGTNDNIIRSTPVTTFAGGNNWKQVSTSGNSRSVGAIKTDGTLWMWGSNEDASLGINATGNRKTPVTTFAGGTNWKQISVGCNDNTQVAAVKTDGSLWTWGPNNVAQLGINIGGGNRNTPVTTFAGGTNWKQVSCGGNFTAAIKTDGSLWVWGQGADGKLGTNDIITRSTPVTTFAGGNDWKQVSCGFFHTAAIKTDGSLWTWGNNTVGGALGINNTTTRSTPVTTFTGGNNWKQVACGTYFTTAIKTDGTLWTWGYNNFGFLGLNDTISRNIPVTTFAGGNNWKQVSGGHTHSAAIKSGLNVDLS